MTDVASDAPRAYQPQPARIEVTVRTPAKAEAKQRAYHYVVDTPILARLMVSFVSRKRLSASVPIFRMKILAKRDEQCERTRWQIHRR